MSTKPRFVSCKQIADKLQMSRSHFYRRRINEQINDCRDRLCPRRFHTEAVEKRLRDNGHEVVF